MQTSDVNLVPQTVHGNRVDASRVDEVCVLRRTRWALCSASLKVLICLVAIGWGGFASDAWSQDERPKSLPDVLKSGNLEPKAFMFPDENGNLVVITDMSFEEIDQARNANAGMAPVAKSYSFDGITVTGEADDEWAELNITFKVTVTPRGGRAAVVPLLMSGFHPQGPLDVAGAEDYTVDFSPESGGYVLWVKSEQQRDIEVSVRAVSRVAAAVGGGLQFNLPLAPTSVDLSVRGEGLEASVVGRGDEAVRSESGDPGRTKVNVECNGGSFSLRWRSRGDGRLPSREPVLEVDGRMRVMWDDIAAPPSVSMELDVSNRRGSLAPFEVRVPEGAEVIEPLQNSAGAQLTLRDAAAGLIQVTPDDEEPASRLTVTIEYRLPSGDYGPDKPLMLTPVTVPTAQRQRGELEVRTDRGYRLRLPQNSAARSAWRASTADTPDARVYLFQYDRVPFELPIWLTAKQQPLRIEHNYAVRVSESAATLEAEITANGTIIEGLPLILETAGWETVEISDVTSDRPLDDPFGDDPNRLEIELAELSPATNGQVGVRWTAARKIDSKEGETVVDFPLPRILPIDQRAAIISPGLLSVRTDEGFSLVSDLVSSDGLSRIPRDPTESSDQRVFRYRVRTVGESARYRGYLKESPLEANVSATVEYFADGVTARVVNDWLVTPRGSLRGQLPIDGVGPAGELLIDLLGSDGSVTATPESLSAARWQVSVNDQPAVVRPGNGVEVPTGVAVIYADQLNGQPCRVRITTEFPFRLPDGDGGNSTARNRARVRMPRPALTGDSLRTGVAVRVVEAPGMKVSVTQDESAAGSSLDLNANPAVVLSVESREGGAVRTPRIERALMRSEIGRSRRYDRMLARVSGGGPKLTVEYVGSANDDALGLAGNEQPVIRVFVDKQEVLDFQRTQNRIEIPLAAADQARLVDIQMWSARDGTSPATSIRPRLRMPISTGKTYWDIVLPTDRHLAWNVAGASELMVWQYDRLFVRRIPTRSYSDLLNWVDADRVAETQPGNRYLLVTSDAAALRVYEAGRPLLWAVISGGVLLTTALLIYYPRLRHPIVAVCGGCLLAGLAWIAPDLAVIAGQLVIVAMLLVAVMMGTRAILVRRPRATVLGGVTDGSSIRSVTGRRTGSADIEPKTTQIQDPVPSGSAVGVRT